MTVDLTGLNLKEFPLFEQVTETDVRKLLSVGFHFRYEAGTQVVSNSDPGETFFLVLKGIAKLVLINKCQEAINVTLFWAGDFFGEMTMLQADGVRNGNVVAIDDLEVIAIHKKDFLKMMQEYPMLAFNLAREMAQRIRMMNQRMITEHLPDDLHKVSHTLLLLANKGKSFQEPGQVLLPSLSLKEWALFCSTSGEIFIDSIETLKQAGALEWQNQRIVITNRAMLERCADAEPEGNAL